MNRVHVGDSGGADHLRNIQIAFRAARRADADRFVREPDVQRVAVCFRIDRDGLDPELLAGSQDAQCDFAAIGD